MNGIYRTSLIQNTLHYLCYHFTGNLHKMPRVHKWTCLRGSEWTPFVDAFFRQQRAETRQLNSKLTAFYYNSVLIIMLCIWQSHSKSLILLLFVLLAIRAEKIINNHSSDYWLLLLTYYNEALLLQRNSTKCISYEINNSRPIYTIYKAAKMFWMNLYPAWSKIKSRLSFCLCQFECF